MHSYDYFFRMCLSQFKLIRYLFFCLKGGDSLVSKLTDKITGASSHKLILAHLPLIMVCIEVIFFIHLIFLKFTFCHVLKMVHKKLAPFGHTIQKLIQTYIRQNAFYFFWYLCPHEYIEYNHGHLSNRLPYTYHMFLTASLSRRF